MVGSSSTGILAQQFRSDSSCYEASSIGSSRSERAVLTVYMWDSVDPWLCMPSDPWQCAFVFPHNYQTPIVYLGSIISSSVVLRISFIRHGSR